MLQSMADDDNWEDEALADQRQSGMTVDAARKILQVNPALRAKGADTDFIIKQGTRSPEQGAQKLNKPPEGARDSGLAAAKDADHLLELAGQSYQKEKRELETQIGLLQAKLSGLKSTYNKAVMDKLEALDRNLSSPMTQAALQQHKKTVDEIGFTPQKYMEYLRQKR
jgi:hypothetical protein